MKNYHNTVPEPTATAEEYQKKAASQEKIILRMYQSELYGLAPKDVYYRLLAKGKNWPITSIRRAISNLSNAKLYPPSGKLMKTGTRSPGLFGRDENIWVVR